MNRKAFRALGGPMSPQEFRAILGRLGVPQVELARIIRADERSVRRWILGEHPVPGAVALALRLWERAAASIKVTG